MNISGFSAANWFNQTVDTSRKYAGMIYDQTANTMHGLSVHIRNNQLTLAASVTAVSTIAICLAERLAQIAYPKLQSHFDQRPWLEQSVKWGVKILGASAGAILIDQVLKLQLDRLYLTANAVAALAIHFLGQKYVVQAWNDYRAKNQADKGADKKEEDKAGEVKVDDKAGEVKVDDKAGEVKADDKAGEVKEEDKAGEVKEEDKAGEVKEEDKAGEVKADDKAGEVKEEDKAGEVKEEDKAGEVKEEDKAGEVKEEDKAGEVKEEDKAGEVKEEDKAGEVKEEDKAGEDKEEQPIDPKASVYLQGALDAIKQLEGKA